MPHSYAAPQSRDRTKPRVPLRPRLSSAPRREERRAALRPGHVKRYLAALPARPPPASWPGGRAARSAYWPGLRITFRLVGAHKKSAGDSSSRREPGILIGMGRANVKGISKKIWGFTKWIVGWPIAIVGLGGIPDSVNVWVRWIDKAVLWAGSAMTDPRVQQLADKAVELAGFVNKAPVRFSLVIVGVSILVWGWRPFWRLRHRIFFSWRRALDQTVWIADDKAIDLVRNSRWARSRKRRAEKPKSFMSLSAAWGVTDPEAQELDQMFYNWCKLSLEQFAKLHENEGAIRKIETGNEYDENKLRGWLGRCYETDLTAEFGQPY